MVNAFHGRQTIEQGIHGAISFVYADATERNAAGPFQDYDGYKLALDFDTKEVYILTDPSIQTWEFFTTIGSSGGDVASVFGRTGSVVAQSGDYDSDEVDNASTVAGASVSDALETLNGLIIGGGGGTVSGPASTTDNAIARWNGTDGYLLQNSGITIDDSNNITGVITVNGVTIESHASRHESGGADEIDGYQLTLTYIPSNYNSPINNIVGEHIAAIDDALASVSGSVSSVFGRIGNVVAVSGDYNSDLVDNASSVPGASTSNAIDYLDSQIQLIELDGYALDSDLQTHITNIANPHSTSIANIGSGTLAQLNTAITDANLFPDSRTITAGAGLTGGGDLSANRTFDVVANVDGSIIVNTNDIQVGILATDGQHGSRGGGSLHELASSIQAGFLSIDGYNKLESIENGAEVNVVDSVFGRTGDIVAQSGDYNSDEITNTSAVSGSNVSDALETLNGLIVGGGSGTVTGPGITTDNAIVRWSGTDGYTIQNSGIIIDDSDNITGVISINGVTIESHASRHENGGADEIEISSLGTSETNTTLVLKPDGAGGVLWGADQGGVSLDGYVFETRQMTAGAGLTGGGDLSADRTFDVVANVDGSIVVNANDIQIGILATDAQHGSRGGGSLHSVATTGVAGFMSATDKLKIDGIENGAQVNTVDSVFGRTGDVVAVASDYDASQVDNNSTKVAGSFVSDALDSLATIIDGYALDSDLTSHTSDSTIHFTAQSLGLDGYALDSDLTNHINNTSNPHSTDIGNLGSGTLAELNSIITDATLDDSSDSRPPSGSAGGDLGGTYPNPTVIDLTISSETTGSILYYDGSNWSQLSPGTLGQFLSTNGAAAPSWIDSVSSAGTSTDNAIVRWNGTDGYTVQNSGVLIDDSDNITGAANISATSFNSVALTVGGGGSLFLADDGTYKAPPGGDVSGPGTHADNILPRFDGTNSNVIQTSGITVDDSDNISGAGSYNGITFTSGGGGTQFLADDGTYKTPAGAGDVVGPGSSTDNAIARFDSTTGKLIQNSSVIIDDSGNMNLGSGNIITTGTVDGVTVSAHASRHISSGSDEIDGDQLDIDWNPTNYVPTTSPTEVTSVDHLTAHLAGIDTVLGAIGGSLTAPTDPDEDGYVVIASSGDLSYIGGVTEGNVLTWDSSQWVASAPKKITTVEFALSEDINNTTQYFYTWSSDTSGGLRSSAVSGIQNPNSCSPYQVPFNATIIKAILTLKGAGVQSGSVSYPVTYQTDLLEVDFTTETKLTDIDFSISNSFTVGTFSPGNTNFKGSTNLSIDVDEGDMLGIRFVNGNASNLVGQTRMAFITLVLEER